MSNKNWYVLHTKPRKEKIAIENLQRQGFTAYCPQTIQAKRRRQCWQVVIEPLFPRYLFVQLKIGIDDFAPIRSTVGVVGLVRFGNQPAVMPISAIETIRQQENIIATSKAQYSPWLAGNIVEVIEGPFVGLRGIFQKQNSRERVMLLLDILGQQRSLDININSIIPTY